ncbi:hypothetical protein IMZ11_06295 [Microtetraspora sp. AC03309]|uniref:M64 family metallopeptidase n=1 Tax=Microtetraspora sp. AC03309 TaxID=2779376 RepID=UPI001E3DB9D3|nr:M64 family metallopeptidase [Microtetraspora sp. AC03309]MCC5575251.1 hypothetical protein [Microtetraspora sp. AC03309]
MSLLLFPHCDLHMVVGKKLKIKVKYRRDGEYDQPHRFDDVTDPTFDFYAPYAPIGHRFDNPPTISNGEITATTPGIYLFQCSANEYSIVGRLQVHSGFEDWWFGNDSITTALDPEFAHAQPTIYARFTSDDTGTDLVGDITGHGYVPLTSTGPAVEVAPEGRLRGTAETAHPVDLIGDFLNKQRRLPVRVVDYGKRREVLDRVEHSRVHDPAKAPNLLFLSEGFRAFNQPDFTHAAFIARGRLAKPRHAPFNRLLRGMNVYQAAPDSTQELLTCGYRVCYQSGKHLAKPVPFEILEKIDGKDDTRVPRYYQVLELVHRVGLPKRDESRDRAALVAEWASQHLDFDGDRVHKDVVEAWKAQQFSGPLQTRDTFFGLHLGQRLADQTPRLGKVSKPAPNASEDDIRKFVQRLYSFFNIRTSQTMHLDPRRHPPELYWPGADNPLTSVYRYIGGLAERDAPHRNVGEQWVPVEERLKPSRGLVVIVAYDDKQGGENIENGLACLTLYDSPRVHAFAGDPAPPAMRRLRPVDGIPFDKDKFSDVVAHELGHSFRLGDEYETTGQARVEWYEYDNLTTRDFIQHGQRPSKFDANKVKWFNLRRVRLASRVVAVTRSPGGGGILVEVPAEDRVLWENALTQTPTTKVCLSRPRSTGRQLPFTVDGPDVDPTLIEDLRGRVLDDFPILDLTGPVPPEGKFLFGPGSVLFIPQTGSGGVPRYLIEDPVRAHLLIDPPPAQDLVGGDPLNAVISAVPSDAPDTPVRIAGFVPPSPASSTIGVYEGGGHSSVDVYRPAGTCKMRNQHLAGDEAEFCFVCKWLIVHRINPALHSWLDSTYRSGRTP